MYREAPRTRDLRKALHSQNGHCRNGNHQVTVDEPLWPQSGFPDLQKCATCELLLACNSAGDAQPPDHLFSSQGSATEAEIAKYPCLRYTRRIRFYYHRTCCIEVDVNARELIDHGTYGYSVTTSRAIRWYLQALRDEGYLSSSRVEELLKIFKKVAHTSNSTVEWHPTRES
jgi:hypothetical protein